VPGVKTEFRIASDPAAEQLLKDIWPDLYATIAADYQDAARVRDRRCRRPPSASSPAS